MEYLVHPLLQNGLLVALDLAADVGGGHGGVLGEIDDLLPGEEAHAVLGVGLTAEVAVGGGGVVLGLAKGEIAG